jgi:hypothetical protein
LTGPIQSFRFGRKTLIGPTKRFIGAGETICHLGAFDSFESSGAAEELSGTPARGR